MGPERNEVLFGGETDGFGHQKSLEDFADVSEVESVVGLVGSGEQAD